MKTALLFLAATLCAQAQFFPFPGPGTIAHSGGGGGTTAYRSSSSTTYASRTNTTLTAPAGIQNNDILIIFLSIGAASPPTPTPPTGFTSLTGFPISETEGGFTVINYCWYKVASSESGNYTVTHATSSSQGYMVAVSGGSSAAPTATTNTGNGTTTTALSITSSKANAFIMFVNQDFADNSNPLSVPTGSTPTFTQRLAGNVGVLMTADGVLASPGATGNKSITNNNLVNPWAGFLIKVEIP